MKSPKKQVSPPSKTKVARKNSRESKILAEPLAKLEKELAKKRSIFKQKDTQVAKLTKEVEALRQEISRLEAAVNAMKNVIVVAPVLAPYTWTPVIPYQPPVTIPTPWQIPNTTPWQPNWQPNTVICETTTSVPGLNGTLTTTNSGFCDASMHTLNAAFPDQYTATATVSSSTVGTGTVFLNQEATPEKTLES